MVIALMKKLKKGVNNRFYKTEGREKEVNAYYLFSDQVELIERVSGGSPSRFLRNWIDRNRPELERGVPNER